MKPYLHFDGMAWPNPRHASTLEYRLRYASRTIKRSDQLVLASIVSAYNTLIEATTKERNRRVASLRKAMSATVDRKAENG